MKDNWIWNKIANITLAVKWMLKLKL
jgi:hypothetical protein